MSVQRYRLPIDTENTGHIRMERSVDLVSDILGADLGERASEARVVPNECAIQMEDIHDGYRSSKASCSTPRVDIALIRLGSNFRSLHLHSTYRWLGWFSYSHKLL
jgi:hypothetical protein